MASYFPITEKELTEALKAEDSIIVIQNGQVRRLKAANLVMAINLAKELEAGNISVGTSDISGIGDGSLTGAIAELKSMIDAMPKITSGTSEPAGGEDGDIYVMHEE